MEVMISRMSKDDLTRVSDRELVARSLLEDLVAQADVHGPPDDVVAARPEDLAGHLLHALCPRRLELHVLRHQLPAHGDFLKVPAAAVFSHAHVGEFVGLSLAELRLESLNREAPVFDGEHIRRLPEERHVDVLVRRRRAVAGVKVLLEHLVFADPAVVPLRFQLAPQGVQGVSPTSLLEALRSGVDLDDGRYRRHALLW